MTKEMTVEEAIAVLKGYIENPLVNDTKVFEMAIKSLEDKGYEQGYADGFADCLDLNT